LKENNKKVYPPYLACFLLFLDCISGGLASLVAASKRVQKEKKNMIYFTLFVQLQFVHTSGDTHFVGLGWIGRNQFFTSRVSLFSSFCVVGLTVELSEGNVGMEV